MSEDRARRREAFAVALSEGNAVGPYLDPDIANSPRADEMRAAGVEENILASEIKRGLLDSRPGRDHLEYLKLASAWLGYRDSVAAQSSQNAGVSTLAGAVAGALAGAREAGLMSEKIRSEREFLGDDAIRVIDAKRVP